ncbi:hypothetical protein [Limnohabitans sp.]|uniref:hypothetical protein n=1 Tax=Limnohabitans sp. TaxID=1907725 RepID=UPI00286EE77E|nr:hypothetical protein [Limnohabitans sp.]
MTDQHILVGDLQYVLRIFRKIRMQDIRDIRNIDTDMLFVMENGQRILWQSGALNSLQEPELMLVFKDGTLRAQQLLKQLESIDIKQPNDEKHLLLDDSHFILHSDAMAFQQAMCIEQKWILI